MSRHLWPRGSWGKSQVMLEDEHALTSSHGTLCLTATQQEGNGGRLSPKKKTLEHSHCNKKCPWKHQPQGIACTQGKHFMCLEEKPGLGELSESLATVAGWISTPGNVPQKPFSKHPRGCKNLFLPVL